MPIARMGTYGAITGLLLGCIIALLYQIPWEEALYRTSILIFSGAWMSATLALLDQLLPKTSQSKKDRV